MNSTTRKTHLILIVLSFVALFSLGLLADDLPFAGQQLDQQRVIFKKLNKRAADRTFLFFDPKENGVEFPNQVIDFDLSLGNILSFGPYKISSDTVKVNFSEEQTHQNKLILRGDQRSWEKRKVISFSWPLSYVFSGQIQIRDDDNNVKWEKFVSQEDVWIWLNHLETRITDANFKKQRIKSLQENAFIDEKGLNKEAADGVMLKLDSGHWGSSMGLVGEDFAKIPEDALLKPFRFCIIKDDREKKNNDADESLLTVCSQRYRLTTLRGQSAVQGSGKSYEPQVIINNKQATLKGRAFFATESQPVQFSALLRDGTYFEFISAPKPINIIDLVLDEKRDQLEIVGYGNPPVGNVEVVRRDSPDFWGFLNFMPTIGDFRNFWRTKVPRDKPVLYLRGEAGFPFRQEIYFKDLPKTRHRVFVDTDAKTSTYKPEVKITGVKSDAKATVQSRQKFAKNTTDESFEWSFAAKKSGEFNRASLLIKTPEDPKVWRTYYEVFRGYSGEISFRSTGVIGSDMAILLLAEGAAQYWFDSLFGWENTLLSVQRWGVAARYFQNVVTINATEETADFKFESTNVELKYRLTPGVWGRDPTIGILGGHQSVKYLTFEVDMLGGGVFWARSMPRFFDSIFNLLPFMRYPKWVDMELLWYPVSLTEDQEISFTFALNFHGKVQWSKQWFGEAGFGLRNFSWSDLTPGKERAIGFAASYGTVGLGYQF